MFSFRIFLIHRQETFRRARNITGEDDIQCKTISDQASFQMGHTEARIITPYMQYREIIDRRAQSYSFYAQYGTHDWSVGISGYD